MTVSYTSDALEKHIALETEEQLTITKLMDCTRHEETSSISWLLIQRKVFRSTPMDRQRLFDELLQSGMLSVVVAQYGDCSYQDNEKQIMKNLCILGEASSLMFAAAMIELGLHDILGLDLPPSSPRIRQLTCIELCDELNLLYRQKKFLLKDISSFITGVQNCPPNTPSPDLWKLLMVVCDSIMMVSEHSKIQLLLSVFIMKKHTGDVKDPAEADIIPTTDLSNAFLLKVDLIKKLTSCLCRATISDMALMITKVAAKACRESSALHSLWCENLSLYQIALEVKRLRFSTCKSFEPANYHTSLGGKRTSVVKKLTLTDSEPRLTSLLEDYRLGSSSESIAAIVNSDANRDESGTLPDLDVLRKLFTSTAVLRSLVASVVSVLCQRCGPAHQKELAKMLFASRLMTDCVAFLNPVLVNSLEFPSDNVLSKIEVRKEFVSVISFVILFCSRHCEPAADYVLQPAVLNTVIVSHSAYSEVENLTNLVQLLSPLLPDRSTVEELLFLLEQSDDVENDFSQLTVRIKGIPGWESDFCELGGCSVIIEIFLGLNQSGQAARMTIHLLHDLLSSLHNKTTQTLDETTAAQTVEEIWRSGGVDAIVNYWDKNQHMTCINLQITTLIVNLMRYGTEKVREELKCSSVCDIVFGNEWDYKELAVLKKYLERPVDDILSDLRTKPAVSQVRQLQNQMNKCSDPHVVDAVQECLLKVTTTVYSDPDKYGIVAQALSCLSELYHATDLSKSSPLLQVCLSITTVDSARLFCRIFSSPYRPSVSAVYNCHKDYSLQLSEFAKQFNSGRLFKSAVRHVTDNNTSDPSWYKLLGIMCQHNTLCETYLWKQGGIGTLMIASLGSNIVDGSIFGIAASHAEACEQQREIIYASNLYQLALSPACCGMLSAARLITSLGTSIEKSWYHSLRTSEVLSKAWPAGIKASLSPTPNYFDFTIWCQCVAGIAQFVPIDDLRPCLHPIASILLNISHEEADPSLSDIVYCCILETGVALATKDAMEFRSTELFETIEKILSCKEKLKLSITASDISDEIMSLCKLPTPEPTPPATPEPSEESEELPPPIDWKGVSDSEYLELISADKLFAMMRGRLVESRPSVDDDCNINVIRTLQDLLTELELEADDNSTG